MIYGDLLDEIRNIHSEDCIYPYRLKVLENKIKLGEVTEEESLELITQLVLDYLKDRRAITQALNKKIVVIDSIMGSGKSTYMINYINNNPNKKFICIVPTLDEIERYMSCINAVTYEPRAIPTKTKGLQELIKGNKNIIATHSLISRIDANTMILLRRKHYTLIIDECLDVVHEYKDNFKKSDLKALFDADYISKDEQGFIIWNEKAQDHDGRYENVKNLCNLHSLMVLKKANGEWSNQVLIWCMPVNFFNLFEKCYICTYLFEGSMQAAYFRLNKISYTHMALLNDVLVPYDSKNEQTQRREKFKLLKIHSDFKGDKDIFKAKNPFTKTWYINQSKNTGNNNQLKRLQDNTSNFFKHIVKSCSSENMYTTYKGFEKYISGKGYTKGFVPCNAKGTNNYSHKSALAYLINLYPPKDIINFFNSYGVQINQDLYALSEMLQWIWRSRIRNGQKIDIYIPSSRMRDIIGRWYLNEI